MPDENTLAEREARVREVREKLRKPPCWGPNEHGEYMVDMSVEAYEADLDELLRAALGQPESERNPRPRPERRSRA